MTNIELYKKVFISSLDFKEDQFRDDLKYQDIDEWDSIGHMSLISALEENFSINFETDDIIAYDSYNKGIEILKKYNVKL